MKAFYRIGSSVGLLALVLLLFFPADAAALNEIINIRHWVAPDHTRIVIDTRDEPQYTVKESTEKIVLEFTSMALPEGKKKWIQILNKPGIKKILLSIRPQQVIRVELVLAAHTETTVFPLKAIEDKPYRVVVDIELPEAAKEATQAREQVRVLKKKRIVVIDPGHGGEAPGAVGKHKTLEKDVVLAIGKKLRDTLNRRKGYHAYLTRTGDYYVPFKKRMQIAKEYGADLFISIHADAEKSRQARGISVYCLSTGGASNEAARLLAKNENLADVIGGVANGNGKDESDAIILNMFQTHTINQSRAFGVATLQTVEAVGPLKFDTVQQAPFLVLKSPEIPSILVETGYISNPEEERLLKKPSYQRRLAEALAQAIVQVLPSSGEATPTEVASSKADATDNRSGSKGADAQAGPPTPDKAPTERIEKGPLAATGTLEPSVASTTAVQPQPRREGEAKTRTKTEPKAETKTARRHIYVVRRGDTLTAIAGRHGVTLAQLKEANDWSRGQRLLSGQKLILPGRSAEPDVAPAPQAAARSERKGKAASVYKLRKGEGLEQIARRFGTDVDTLCRLNNLRRDRPLYVDRLLVLPQPRREGEAKAKTSRRHSYVVRNGDTLTAIAVRHRVTLAQLKEANDWAPGQRLLAGQKLILPGPAAETDGATTHRAAVRSERKGGAASVYKVRKGEGLEQIARRFGTDVDTLCRLNNLRRDRPLYVDRLLVLPRPPAP